MIYSININLEWLLLKEVNGGVIRKVKEIIVDQLG